MRFGIKNLKTAFLFFSAIAFNYFGYAQDRMRFGIKNLKTAFLLFSALTFHYLCKPRKKGDGNYEYD